MAETKCPYCGHEDFFTAIQVIGVYPATFESAGMKLLKADMGQVAKREKRVMWVKCASCRQPVEITDPHYDAVLEVVDPETYKSMVKI